MLRFTKSINGPNNPFPNYHFDNDNDLMIFLRREFGNEAYEFISIKRSHGMKRVVKAKTGSTVGVFIDLDLKRQEIMAETIYNRKNKIRRRKKYSMNHWKV